MQEVELRIAWGWECPKCEADNFDRAVAVEVPPGDPVLEMLSDAAAGGLCMKPHSVRCHGCGTRFQVAPDGDDNGWDEDGGDGWSGS